MFQIDVHIRKAFFKLKSSSFITHKMRTIRLQSTKILQDSVLLFTEML